MRKSIFKSIRIVMAVIMTATITVGGNDVFNFGIENIFAGDDVFEAVKCGDHAIWSLDASNRVLTISGTGAIDRFTYSKDVTSVVICEGITSIGANAFSNSTLVSISLPDSLTTIGESAFWGCEELTDLTLPSKVSSIGEVAFEKCISLKNITVDEENLTFSSEDGVLYDKNKTELLLYPAAKEDDSFIIPSSVTKLGLYAFDYNSTLKNLTIPAKVISLGGGNPFTCAKALENITVDKNNEIFSSVAGNLYNKNQTQLIKYAIGKTDSSLEIMDSVTTIAQGAFQYCSALTNVTLPVSVSNIEYGAFADCISLNFLTINNPNCKIASSILSGVPKDNGLTISGYADSTAKSYSQSNGISFLEIQEKEIAFIEIASLPKKTIYAIGENFNSVGLTIKVVYTDNTFTERSMGYTVSDLDTRTEGIHTLIVTYSGKTTAFDVQVVKELAPVTIANGQLKTVDIIEPGQLYFIHFTPQESGLYDFYAISDSDTVGYIYDVNGNILAENDDTADGNNNFFISYHLEADTTYILGCKLLNEEEIGSFDVIIYCDKENETPENPDINSDETTEAEDETTTGNKEIPTTAQVQETTVKTEKNTATNPDVTSYSKEIKPARVTMRKPKNLKGKKVKLTWKKSKKVSGYIIKCATNKKFTKNLRTIRIVKADAKSKIVKKMKLKKIYYFKIRAYRIVNGKKIYGDWSKYRKIKIKK